MNRSLLLFISLLATFVSLLATFVSLLATFVSLLATFVSLFLACQILFPEQGYEHRFVEALVIVDEELRSNIDNSDTEEFVSEIFGWVNLIFEPVDITILVSDIIIED